MLELIAFHLFGLACRPRVHWSLQRGHLSLAVEARAKCFRLLHHTMLSLGVRMQMPFLAAPSQGKSVPRFSRIIVDLSTALVLHSRSTLVLCRPHRLSQVFGLTDRDYVLAPDWRWAYVLAKSMVLVQLSAASRYNEDMVEEVLALAMVSMEKIMIRGSRPARGRWSCIKTSPSTVCSRRWMRSMACSSAKGSQELPTIPARETDVRLLFDMVQML